MNNSLPDFLQPLHRITDGYPADAIADALQRSDEYVPHLLRSLEQALADPASTLEDPRYMLHLYALFILGYLKEPQARELVFAIARHPEIDDIIGDAITCGLGPILANLSLDNPTSLYPLIEDTKADPFARGAALQALGVLHHFGNLDRETLSNYLTELYTSKLERESTPVWDAAVSLSATFALAEHRETIRDAYKNGYADEYVDRLEDVEAALSGNPIHTDYVSDVQPPRPPRRRTQEVGLLRQRMESRTTRQRPRGRLRRRPRSPQEPQEPNSRHNPRLRLHLPARNAQSRPQRALPLRQRQEIQEVLRQLKPAPNPTYARARSPAPTSSYRCPRYR